jgi:hypothetical protein
MFENYNGKVRRALFFARHYAYKLENSTIDSEHFLLGILREYEGQIWEIFARLGVKPEDIWHAIVGERIFDGTSTTVEMPLSEESKRILAYTSREAEIMHHATVGPEHLLLGILREEGCTAMRILGQHGVAYSQARKEVLSIIKIVGEIASAQTQLAPPQPERINALRPASPAQTRDKVFISYSHRDREWLNRLHTMLKPVLRGGGISLWDDTRIKPGTKWKDEIARALGSARVAVLLVSGDFLASDFVIEHELAPILEAAAEEGVTVLWIYLSHCLYEETDLVHYQAAHDIALPLESLSRAEQNHMLVQICRRIKESADSYPAASD